MDPDRPDRPAPDDEPDEGGGPAEELAPDRDPELAPDLEPELAPDQETSD
jgi:hypothetical protein